MSSLPDRARALERKLHMQRMRVFEKYEVPPEVKSVEALHERLLRVAIARNRSGERAKQRAGDDGE